MSESNGVPTVDHTDQKRAVQNIKACRKALKAFLPIAPPTLWKELSAAVDKHEDAVRTENGLPKRR